MTNELKIKTASAEDLASILIDLCENNSQFCKCLDICADDLREDVEIPLNRCCGCMLEWLRKPAEGGADG